MSKFNELLAQLQAENEAQETLAKALPQDSQDDKNIQAAAEDEGNGDNAGEGEGEGDGEGEGEGEGEEGTLTKSLTLENGEEAIDATELLKSLQAGIGEHDEVLAKALPMISGMFKQQNEMIAQQGELIKSMQTRIDQLAGQGRGRKTVVTVQEKLPAGETTLAKSQNDGLTPQEFMLKANTAFDKKILTGQELTTIDVCLRSGQMPDAALIQKVVNS